MPGKHGTGWVLHALVSASRRCCHSSLSSPTSSESVFIKTCWQHLHAANEDWSYGLMLNLGTGGLSEKLWECPLIYISHTLRTLRIIWEHIKNAYSWFQPPGDAECMNMELGPVTCVFYNLPRWISATTSLSLSTCMHLKRKWQPIPVFLPGESQGRGSLVGCHLWGRTELDTTAVT